VNEWLPFGRELCFDHPGKNKIASGGIKCGGGDSNGIVTMPDFGGVGTPRGLCRG
jgi:hypothetical protein